MSVFKSIRGTFAAGLKSFTSRDHGKDDVQQHVKSGVSLDAGADLLDRYQNTWKELHQNAEQSATVAEDVDNQITQLYVKYDRQIEVLDQLHEAVASLPIIMTQLQELTDVLASLDEEYDNVEAAMVHLEDVCEDQELTQAKMYDVQKLAAYQHRKGEDIQKIKVELAKDHAKKMEGHEKQRQTQLKERQQVFEEAFNNDLDYFRSHGRLDRLSTSSNESGKRTDLADISWDTEDAALNEFLETGATISDENEAAMSGTQGEHLDEDVDETSEEEEEEEESEEEERIDVTLPRYTNNKSCDSVPDAGGGEINPSSVSPGGEITPSSVLPGGEITPSSALPGGEITPSSVLPGGEITPSSALLGGEITPSSTSPGVNQTVDKAMAGTEAES